MPLYRLFAAAVFTCLLCLQSSEAQERSIQSSPQLKQADPYRWVTRETKWNEFRQLHFQIEQRSAYIVVPEQAAPGNPWIWRARFPGYHDEMDLALVRQGFHLGYVDVAGLFGSPNAIHIGDQFYDFVTSKLRLSKRPSLEGVSRGGLFVYNWAVANPEKVACIYCDTPVCDFKSWPGGLGKGLGSAADWTKCIQTYGITEEQALEYQGNPIDHAAIIAKAKIPLLHIVSENDQIVPPAENTYVLSAAIERQGHALKVISLADGTAESKGHHFSHPQPQQVIDFFLKHAAGIERKTAAFKRNDKQLKILSEAKRIVFLGDSITYAGGYVVAFDAWLCEMDFPHQPKVINVGLPSETVSGLSEAGHAGGKFPRPDLKERLDRVLKITKPELVFACYGINCGIYLPMNQQRFEAYQEGIIHLEKQVEAAGAKLILITPPTFDDQRSKLQFSYNRVLDQYSDWLVSKRQDGWNVIDLHTAMKAELEKQRRENSEFTFQPDAVHPNASGHAFIAQQIVEWFEQDKQGLPELTPERRTALQQRMEILRDAYLSAAGHKRPGIGNGLPIDQAEKKATQLNESLAK